ncbi:hypothetical protein E2P81_ATG10083 [Venturia nashicola]|uniref:Uncharacterized protein n=1 Tax=Venturia nashicola TaxID=86259 RepID=A0A4Z1NXH9_9PEZI|nr:hypothetical protein E6O75_ATG10303 [Venturia nashicola]TLD18261.1 hypothetical protein E2P81_ATG10083 [Venturia nashicola]
MIVATSLFVSTSLNLTLRLVCHISAAWLPTFLQPGFIPMATLTTIREESSNGHIEGMDGEETQLVPETQLDDDNANDLDLGDKESDGRPATRGRDSMTPTTKKVLEESRPLSSHGTALAATDLTFQLERPKSSGEDPFTGGFTFAKHQIPKMNFQHGKRQQSASPEVEKQREAKEYREEKLQTIKVPTKPSHIQQEGPAGSVTDSGIYPSPHQTQHVTSGHDISDRLPAKKSSRTKSNEKKFKEKVRVPRETGLAIRQYENPVHVSVSREAGESGQQHENIIQIYDASVNPNPAWPEDQQAPQQDNAMQPVEQHSLHRESQNTVQSVAQNRWQQQAEQKFDEDHWHEQPNAIQVVGERQWQPQNETQVGKQPWYKQQGTMPDVNDQSWQRQAEVHPPDEQQWQEQQTRSVQAGDEQAWQQENQLRSNDKTTLHQSGMKETLHAAGGPCGDTQLHSRSVLSQQSDFLENNGRAVFEHHAIDSNVGPVQHVSNPTPHGNNVQPMTIATGITGVTKKKKKKKKKTKVKPALDVRTLPEVPFGVPFDQLDQVQSAENLRRDSNQDSQPGLTSQPFVPDLRYSEVFQDSHVVPKASDQHDSRPVAETIEEAMDIDQQNQVQETQHVSPHVVDKGPTTFPSLFRSSVPEETSHPRQSNGAGSRQVLPGVAASPGERPEHEVHDYRQRGHEEAIADGYDERPQHDAQHRPQVKSALVNDQATQDASAQKLRRHTDGGLELRGDPQYRALHHAPPDDPFHVVEPVLQDVDSKQNCLGQDSEITNQHRGCKHRAPQQAALEEFSELDEHVRQSLHAQEIPLGRTTEVREHRAFKTSQYHTPHRSQLLLSRGNIPRPHQFLTQSHNRAQQVIQAPEYVERVQTPAEPSQSLRQHPVIINAQPSTPRRGVPASIGRKKLYPRRGTSQQTVVPVAQLTLPTIDVPTANQAGNAADETHPNPVTEAYSFQDDPVSGALKVLQFTLRQDLQASITKENEARRALQSEIAELKVSEARLQAEVTIVTASKNELIETSKEDREKLKTYLERLTQVQKFINGVNNDLAKEKQNARALHQQITELVDEGKASAIERKQVYEQLTKAIEASKTVQTKWIKELTDARLLIQKFELEKMSLEKELREKNQLLEDERDQRLRLADDIRFQAVDQQLMKQLISDTSASLLQTLSELQLTVTNSKDTVTSQGVAELLQLVKSLASRNHVCPADLAGLKEHIDSFQKSMINRMSELQLSCTSDSPEVVINAQVALDLEQKLTEQLLSLKSDVLSTQSLQTQLGQLREAKATSDERGGAKDQQISDLNEQLGRLQEAKNTLIERLNQAEAQLREHTSGPSDEEFESVKQELGEAQRKLETADETEKTLRTEIETLQESIQAKEGRINAIAEQKLESERKAAQNLASMRSQLSREAQQLRQEQQAEFDNKIHQKTQRHQQAVAAQQKSERLNASYASAIESSNKDHAAALDTLKRYHESAIETMRKNNTAAMESQSRRLQEEARKKVDDQRRDLNDKADREKDELHRRIAAAETEKDNALRSLEKAKQEAEEIIKKQTEKTRSDLNDLQSRLRAEAQQESERLTQSHSKEQDVIRQRAAKAEAELQSLRNTLKDQLTEPCQPSQLSEPSQPARPSQRDFQPTISSAEPNPTPFKKPRRKVDRRELARPGSRVLSDDGVSLQNANPATPVTQWPKIRTFAEIDSMISESFQIFEDPDPSSELTDLPSSLPSGSPVLRELPVTDARGNAQPGTASSNGSFSNPFFGPVRPRSREYATANSAMRVTGGSTQVNSSMAASRITETQHRSLSALDDLPSEIEDSQTQSRRLAFSTGKENRPPINGAPVPGESATRSAHFQTPKPKDKCATHEPTQTSSPDYLSLSQPRHSLKITTYGHNKQANHPSSGQDSQHASRNDSSSSVKRRRDTNAAEDKASRKRRKTTKEQPVLQFEISESQSQYVDSQRIAESSAQRISETQLQHSEFNSQHSQVLPRSAAPPIAKNRMPSLPGTSPRPNSQPRPSSAEHVSQSRARTSSTTRSGAAAANATAANRGKGRTVAGRSSASRYDLRFSQELNR